MQSGETRVTIRLLGMRSYRDVEMIVDPSRRYTRIPEPLARELGIVLAETIPARLRDGTSAMAGFGEVSLEMGGGKYRVPVVVGPNGTPVLGHSALLILHLRLNPFTRKLEPFLPKCAGPSKR